MWAREASPLASPIEGDFHPEIIYLRKFLNARFGAAARYLPAVPAEPPSGTANSGNSGVSVAVAFPSGWSVLPRGPGYRCYVSGTSVHSTSFAQFQRFRGHPSVKEASKNDVRASRADLSKSLAGLDRFTIL